MTTSITTDVTMLQQRLTLLEEIVNKMQELAVTLATQNDLDSIVISRQDEWTQLREDLDTLWERVEILRQEVFN